jgi:Cu(I)/Ag(I) efflux system membrane fusion protein
MIAHDHTAALELRKTAMTTRQNRSGRSTVLVLLALVVGAAGGVGATWAHFTGRLAHLYHTFGIHSAHQAGPGHETGVALGGHAGHGTSTAPAAGGGEPSRLPGYSIVTITPERQQLIGVRTGKVERGRLVMSIRAVGIIEPDQTRLRRVHTRISGWVTKVHVNFVGQNVKKDDPLLELYSPDLLQTQLDFLQAVESWESMGKNRAQRRLVDAARRRLELWGVPADEIERLRKTRKARDTLLLRAPISGRVLQRSVREGSYVQPADDLYRIADLSVVWLQAKVYQYELPHIERNQPVRVILPSAPDVELRGKVSFVEPVLQEAARTVNVRVQLDNPKGTLLPGMYADLLIDHDMGSGLLVPESGLLRTGERSLAFRVLPGHRFEPVEVRLGSRFKERFEVLGGLEEGDEIVTSAAFLIDSESRLKSATGAMSGHEHGSMPDKPRPEEPAKGGHKGHKGHKGHEGHEH